MNKKAFIAIILGACFMQPQVFGMVKPPTIEQTALAKSLDGQKWSQVTTAIRARGPEVVQWIVNKRKIHRKWTDYLQSLPTNLNSQVKETLLTALWNNNQNVIQQLINTHGLLRIQEFAQDVLPQKWQAFTQVLPQQPGPPPVPPQQPGPPPVPPQQPGPPPVPPQQPGPPPVPPQQPGPPPLPPRPSLDELKELNREAIDRLKAIGIKLKQSGDIDLNAKRQFVQEWQQAVNDFTKTIGK